MVQQFEFTTFNGSKDGTIKKTSVSKPALRNNQVYVQVTASGLCGTDLHMLKNDMALGHEGVGVVKELGPEVKHLKIGDRVGWGYQHDSCGLCHQCLRGLETYCEQRAMYGSADTDQGSIATGAVWKESFLFKIPDNLSDEEAAPLMCGGATVFTPLIMYGITPSSHVGVVGVGGLGHLAIQFASKMGCRVTVFSGTESKKEEATKLGASSFIATKGKDKLDIGEHKIDALLVTTSVALDWNLYTDIMGADSVIFPLSVAEGDFSIPYMTLILKGMRIQGSVVAPRHIHKQMLEFASLHGIKPIIQKYKMDQEGVEKCIHDLDQGNMRYRGVIVPQ